MADTSWPAPSRPPSRSPARRPPEPRAPKNVNTGPSTGESAGPSTRTWAFGARFRPAIVPAVIRAILHLMNDQPLAVDLLEQPTPGDIAVICTNVRTLDGKRPVFIDFTASTFVFPMAAVRFVEIPQTADEAARSALRL